MRESFSKEDSLVVKGVAILIMMWHHCFLTGRFEKYTIQFTPFSVSQVTDFAEFGKICVSMFAFITGYGLYSAYRKNEEKQASFSVTKWIKDRYVKSFSPYWFVVLLTWTVTYFIDCLPKTIYFGKDAYHGAAYMIIDFLGLANLFDTPTMVATWWYMSACFAFILLTPLIVNVQKKMGPLFLMGSLFLLPRCMGGYPGGMHFLTFLPAFCMGMIFADGEVFSRLDELVSKGKRTYFLVLLCSLLFSAAAFFAAIRLPRKTFWDVILGIFPAIHIISTYLTLCRVPGLKQILLFLGKNSANIYMTHNFLRGRYLTRFIYSRGHFLLCILVLLLMSIGISLIIDLLKKALRYDKLVRRVFCVS